jgi:hypothetical protein
MMEEGGLVVDTGLLERRNIQNVVARKTIRYCLFVNSQEELSWSGVFAQITLGYLGIGNGMSDDDKKNCRKQYWHKHAKHAYHCLNSKRSNMNTNIGKAFKGMWSLLVSLCGIEDTTNQFDVYVSTELYSRSKITADRTGEEEEEEIYFPSLDSIKLWRDDEDAWVWAMKHFLLYVEPSRKERVQHDLLSNWCTVSSEVVLCVLLENSYEMWTQEVEYPRNEPIPSEETNSFKRKVAKWTSNAQSGIKFKGWDDEGIKRFNELGEIVQKARKDEDTGENLEESLKEAMKDMKGGNKKRKRLNEHRVEPRYDLPEGFELHTC